MYFVHPFAIHCVMLQAVFALLESWRCGFRDLQGSILWWLTLVSILWSLWLEQNYHTSHNKLDSIIGVAMKAQAKVISLVLTMKQFNGLMFSALLRCQEELCGLCVSTEGVWFLCFLGSLLLHS